MTEQQASRANGCFAEVASLGSMVMLIRIQGSSCGSESRLQKAKRVTFLLGERDEERHALIDSLSISRAVLGGKLDVFKEDRQGQ